MRLTNAHGTVPLVIGEAHLALRGSGAAIGRASDRRLAFGGSRRVTIAPGAEMVSTFCGTSGSARSWPWATR